MRRQIHLFQPALVILVMFGFVATCWAVYPPLIDDKGKFFSKETLDKANKKIRSIYEKYKMDVVIVTLPNLSPEQLKKLDEDGKTKYFARLSREASVEIGLNGIYILLSKKPSHLQVHMDPATQKKIFTAANRKTLIAKIVERFKEDHFDAGLLDGLDTIETVLKGNSK